MRVPRNVAAGATVTRPPSALWHRNRWPWSTSGQCPDAFFIFGGTSAGSPQWAGLISLADQLKHGRVGLINSKLYGLASSPATYAGLFHEITKGDNTHHGAVTVPGFKAT